MRFHVDADSGFEIALWIAPDHPNEVPRVNIWDAGQLVAKMEANVTREDVRQLGMHSTGQVGFSITSDNLPDIDRKADVAITYLGEEADGGVELMIYRRARGTLQRSERLLIIDSAAWRVGNTWNVVLKKFSQSYPNLALLSAETLISVLGNEFAHSIGAVGFPYLGRIRGIPSGQQYQIVFVFRDPLVELACQIDHLLKAKGELTVDRKSLLSLFREIPEADAFELSNPVMRRLLKAPGEQVSSKDTGTALRQLSQLDLVVTDRTREQLVARKAQKPIFLPAAPAPSKRQAQIAGLLRQMPVATDMIAEDLELYDLTSGAIERACAKLPPASDGRIAE